MNSPNEMRLDGQSLDFVPPIGFDKMNLPSLPGGLSDDQELILFRIPDNMELKDLIGLKIPAHSSTEPSTFKCKEVSYALNYVGSGDDTPDDSIIEAGEMRDMVCLAPKDSVESPKKTKKSGSDATGVLDAHGPTVLRILPKSRISRMYHVGIDMSDTSKPDEFVQAGEVILNRPFVKRQQPHAMKLQSPPIGFDTAGKPLEESLKFCPEVITEVATDKKKTKRKKSMAETTPVKKKKSKKE